MQTSRAVIRRCRSASGPPPTSAQSAVGRAPLGGGAPGGSPGETRLPNAHDKEEAIDDNAGGRRTTISRLQRGMSAMSRFGSEPVRDPERLGFDKARLARLKQWMQRYADAGRWP